MSNIVQAQSYPLPLPQVPVNIRLATLADLPFIDGLQKKQSKQVGWMPTQQLEGKVAAGSILIAEKRHEGVSGCGGEGVNSIQCVTPSPAHPITPASPLGYIIAQDQYFKRDDVGIIYQINVVPEARRSFVAAGQYLPAENPRYDITRLAGTGALVDPARRVKGILAA